MTAPLTLSQRLRLIADMEGQWDVSLSAEGASWLREAAEALEATCASCRFFRSSAGTETGDDICTHPSEVNPMHWQETRETFGCNMHEPVTKEPLPPPPWRDPGSSR